MEILRRKKGGFEDAFFVIVVLLGVILFLLILNKAWGEIKNPLDEGLSASLPSDSSVNITNTIGQVTSTSLMFDKLMPFLLIGLFAFVLIGAAIYMQHPIMAIVGIIILAVAILLAAVYSNVYHQISQADEFAATTASLPISDTLMKYLPVIIIIIFIGIISAIAWSRKSGGGGL